MISRGTIIAGLIALELAIVVEAVVAVRGAGPWPASAQPFMARAADGPKLAEGGPHKIFDSGAHPKLTVDIGYADLTILTSSNASQIDVSLSPSDAFGPFSETAPITARQDGETIRVATSSGGRRWSLGDDRMVTVLVPPETKVTVIHAGDVKADGLRADASFNSVGNGTVTVEDYDAPSLHVVSSDGRIVLRRIESAQVEVTSKDGRVDGTALQVRDGHVESSGRVSLRFAAGTDTLVNAEASDGKISTSGFAGTDVVTKSKGSDDDDDDDDSSARTVRVGAGEGHLDVHSSDGNITLAQDG
jgi:hypothetical protein